MEWFRNLPIGQYVPGNSFLHRMDPRTKILLVLLYVILIFFADSYGTLSLYLLLAALAVLLSRMSPRYLWKGLKGMLFIIVVLGLFQVFFLDGGRLLWAWGWIQIYGEGIRQAGMTVVRLTLVVIITSLLTLTTLPTELTYGLERLLRPLNRVGFPVHEFALMMTIAIRFIPVLLEETDKIVKAQVARGADFESRNPGRRLKALLALLIPLFIGSFRRAEDLALAMEARCYRGGIGRTYRKRLRFGWRDSVAGGAALAVFAATFLL